MNIELFFLLLLTGYFSSYPSHGLFLFFVLNLEYSTSLSSDSVKAVSLLQFIKCNDLFKDASMLTCIGIKESQDTFSAVHRYLISNS